MNLSAKSMVLLKKHGFNNTLQLFEESGSITNGRMKTDKNDNNFILQAKKVILEEQYDKLSNMHLGEIRAEEINENYNEIRENIEKTVILDNFSNKLISFNDTGKLGTVTIRNTKSSINIDKILAQYFQKWKNYAFNECHKLENNVLVEKKLNNLVQSINDNMLKPETIKKFKIDGEKKAKSSPTLYINRYNAQRNIIQQQKEKLEEQQRLIEELKFNKIKQDIEKSVEQSKYEIQNIFKNCSTKIKCKVGKIVEDSSMNRNSLENSSDGHFKFVLKSVQVPQMVKEMEKRAMDRKLNRQIIRERKRIIDEKRKKMAEELLEKKRMLDEEETKRNLDMMKENRLREMEKEKLRKKNKEQYMINCKIADEFYEARTVKMYFDSWLRLISTKEFNETKAECYYERKIQNTAFKCLSEYSRTIIEEKHRQADNLYNFKLKKYSMAKLQYLLKQKRRNFQVAQDFYDMKIEQIIFIQWHRNVCQLQMIELKLIKRAEMHYLKKIKFHYFYQWHSLSAVLLLEKAKEEKRMKWRRKVLEVLPDYRPPIED